MNVFRRAKNPGGWGGEPWGSPPLPSQHTIQLSLGKAGGQMEPAGMSQPVSANLGLFLALMTHLCSTHQVKQKKESCLGAPSEVAGICLQSG